jgi:hypothetical protein
MKRLLITSTQYAGTAELLYTAGGRLLAMDVSRAEMDGETLQRFKRAVPIHIDGIAAAFGPGCTIVEATYEVSFEQFWNAYGHKINRKRCEAIWNRMSAEKRVQAWAGVAAYDRFLKRNEWRKKADPETYLRKEYYMSEWD